MEAKIPNRSGFSSKGESPPLGDEKGEIDWSGLVVINKMKEFTLEGQRERTMSEKMVVRFGICGIEQTHMRGQNKIWVQKLEAIWVRARRQASFKRKPWNLGGTKGRQC